MKETNSWESWQEDTFETVCTEESITDPKQRKRVDFILENIEKGSEVLSVGSNHGDIEEIIRKQGNHVFCLELPRVAAVGMRKNSKLHWFKGSGEDPLPFENERFDVVVATEVIEHLRNLEEFISECFRVLKPGGIILVSTPNVARPINVVQMMMGLQVRGFFHDLEKPLHLRFYTPFTLSCLLARGGFVNPECIGADTGNDGFPYKMFTKEENEWFLKLMSKFRKYDVMNASVVCCRARKPK